MKALEAVVLFWALVVNQGQQVDAWLYSTNKALITVSKRIKIAVK